MSYCRTHLSMIPLHSFRDITGQSHTPITIPDKTNLTLTTYDKLLKVYYALRNVERYNYVDKILSLYSGHLQFK